MPCKGQFKYNLTGQYFGEWFVLGPNEKSGCWDTLCSCGNQSIVGGYNLICGNSTKCLSCARTKHGYHKRKEYRAWANMIDRCHNPNDTSYTWYGNIGIYVCNNLRYSFIEFIKMVGDAPSPKHILDRIDNDQSYTCGTCPHCIEKDAEYNIWWATREQSDRNKSNSNLFVYNGKLMCLKDIAVLNNIPTGTLWSRIFSKGLPLEEALKEPEKGPSPKAKLYIYDNKELTLQQVANLVGIEKDTLRTRMNRQGLSLYEAIMQENRYKNSRHK